MASYREDNVAPIQEYEVVSGVSLQVLDAVLSGLVELVFEMIWVDLEHHHLGIVGWDQIAEEHVP